MRHVLCLLSLCVVALAAPVADADGLVLESYVGERPPDAARLTKGLLEELSRRDFLSAGAMIQFESRVSKPALTEAGLPVDFVPQVELGHKAWINGNFEDSLRILQPLVQKAHENPGAFAQNQQQLRERLFRAHVGIAVSQMKVGDPGSAKATFSEILRSFPDQTVSRSVYGPEVASAYEQTKKELGGLKRGSLIVNLTGDTGPIYVNEKFENVGKVTKLDMYPGEYRVFAAPAKGLTRSHRVTIAPGETATLTIDTGFDLAVQAKTDWIGLTFASVQDRTDNEALYAAKVAKALDKDSVVVVSLDKIDGRRTLVGAIVDMIGRKDLRRASIALDPAPAPRIVLGLAKFLTSGEEAEGIEVQVTRASGTSVAAGGSGYAGGPGGGPVDRPAAGGTWGGWKWITGVGALGALGAGGYLLYLDGKCPTEPPMGFTCADNYEHTTVGWLTVAGGGVMLGVSIYLFARGDGDPPTRTGFVVPTRGGAMAGYSLSF